VHAEGLRARIALFARATFRRVAAAIVLPDHELFRRQAEQHAREGKTVPEDVILGMRGAHPHTKHYDPNLKRNCW